MSFKALVTTKVDEETRMMKMVKGSTGVELSLLLLLLLLLQPFFAAHPLCLQWLWLVRNMLTEACSLDFSVTVFTLSMVIIAIALSNVCFSSFGHDRSLFVAVFHEFALAPV